jgi:hypothetical protein
MIAVKTVTTPASTVAGTPLVSTWGLVLGLIYKVEIFFPPGSRGLLGVALHSASHRVYPFGDDEYFIGDNCTISFDDELYFDLASKQLEIHTYNLDDYYSHTLQFRLGIQTDPELIKSKYGISNIEALTTSVSALVGLITLQNTASGKYSSDALGDL